MYFWTIEVLPPAAKAIEWTIDLTSFIELATYIPEPRLEFSPGLIIQILGSPRCSKVLNSFMNLAYSGSELLGVLTLKVKGIATANGSTPIE